MVYIAKTKIRASEAHYLWVVMQSRSNVKVALGSGQVMRPDTGVPLVFVPDEKKNFNRAKRAAEEIMSKGVWVDNVLHAPSSIVRIEIRKDSDLKAKGVKA
jgi:hypothetical protein